MRLASFLISVAIAVAAYPAGPLGATGLYTDLRSYFSASDSSRALVVLRQSECDLGTGRASLLVGDLLIHPRPRFEIRIGIQFPAVRDNEGIRYGVGDLMLHASARLAGDSASASGLFARADARIPTGSDALRPFSDASFEGEAGFEARFVTRAYAVKAAAVYTLSSEDRQTVDFTNSEHFTLAASIDAGLSSVASFGASAFFVRFDNGEERQMFAISLGRELSPQLLFELAGAFETGSAGSRVFDSCFSASFVYRFPPRSSAPPADSTKP